jgi:hypothetical protein
MTFTLHLQCNKIRLYEPHHVQLQLIQTNELRSIIRRTPPDPPSSSVAFPLAYVRADVAGAGAKWMLWAVIKWEGGVLWW